MSRFPSAGALTAVAVPVTRRALAGGAVLRPDWPQPRRPWPAAQAVTALAVTRLLLTDW